MVRIGASVANDSVVFHERTCAGKHIASTTFRARAMCPEGRRSRQSWPFSRANPPLSQSEQTTFSMTRIFCFPRGSQRTGRGATLPKSVARLALDKAGLRQTSIYPNFCRTFLRGRGEIDGNPMGAPKTNE